MSDDIKKLELRITELENQLKGLKGQGGQADIDPADMKVYEKVSKQLGISAGTELQPMLRCIACLVCYRCVNECICGPCNICVIGGVGGTRFSALG